MRAFGCICFIFALEGAHVAAQEPTYTNSIGIEFVLIKPGSVLIGRFQPGCPSLPVPGGAAASSPAPARNARAPQDPRTRWSPEDDRLCEQLVKQDARPGFTVRIERPFYLGKYEVTQGQWKSVMGSNPSVFQRGKVKDESDRHPVDSVTWRDTQAFLRKLNAMEKTKLYRLPSEFEWEYAGKAGSPDDPAWREIREVAWEQDINKGTTHVVGTKKPNPWGLYDMLGNVWEWVQDYYNEEIFPDPTPPHAGNVHVLKGGGFLSDVKNVVYSTHGGGPGSGFDVGFRIVRGLQ